MDKQSEYEAYQISSKMKKTSPGSDEIPYLVYRKCAVELTLVVTDIINLSLRICSLVVPSVWKRPLVTRFEGQTDFGIQGHSDLRLILVTSILSRTVKRIVIVQKYLWLSPNDDMENDQVSIHWEHPMCTYLYVPHDLFNVWEWLWNFKKRSCEWRESRQ